MSPELLCPEKFDLKDDRRTKHSDCYALGMVAYEVLSRKVPFFEYSHYAISGEILAGKRPGRPQGKRGVWFTDDVWKVLERCWTPQPRDRPSIEDVLQHLREVSRSWVLPSPQLSPVSSIAGSLTWGFSDGIATESADGSGISSSQVALPQPSAELDLVESTGIVNGVSWASLFDEFWS